MKRIAAFFLALVLLLGLTGCQTEVNQENLQEAKDTIGNWVSGLVPTKVSYDRDSTYEAPESEQIPGMEPEELVLVNDEEVGIELVAIEDGVLDGEHGPEFTLRGENRTDRPLWVTAGFTALNGFEFTGITVLELAPGETVEDKMYTRSDIPFDKYGFASLDELNVWFVLYYDADFEELRLLEPVTVPLSGGGGEAGIFDEDGTVVYDADGVKVVVLEEISEDGLFAYVLARNDSEDHIIVQTGETAINGQPTEARAELWLRPGFSDATAIYLGDPNSEALEPLVEDIREIVTSFSVLRRTTFVEEEEAEPLGESGEIVCPLRAHERLDTVIAQQDGITVTATDFRKSWLKDRYALDITVENRTESELYFRADSVYLNGCEFSGIGLTVPANETVEETIYINKSDLPHGADPELKTVQCVLSYREMQGDDDRVRYLDCAEITLSPGEVEPIEPFGVKLCSVRGVDLYLTSFYMWEGLADAPRMKLLVVNNSDRDVIVENGEATRVNGKEEDWGDYGSFDEVVPAGGYATSVFSIFGGFGLDEIEQLRVRFLLRDPYTDEVIGKSETVEISFD